MRVALLSDIHSNLAALEAVLAAVHAEGIDAVWNMGDLVGYGPDPDSVVSAMQDEAASCVMGNHDAAALELIPIDGFNELAQASSRWTVANISDATRRFLAAMPRIEVDGDFSRCHGTLRDPIWEYLDPREAAAAHFDAQSTPFSIVGHTHHQMLVTRSAVGETNALVPWDDETHALNAADGMLSCINPGSVGQPRDGDPRACYALLDTTACTVAFHRVAYDIAATQQRMQAAGLPEALASRLSTGH